MFCPPDYQALRCDRVRSRGGGVMALYKCTLPVNKVDTVDNNFQLICVDLHAKHSFVRLCCVYLPPCPSDTVVLDLCNKLNSLIRYNLPTFIFGDFNLPNIDWSIPCNKGNSAHSVFLNFCSTNALHQCVDFSTHEKGNILDLVLCNQTGKNVLLNCSPVSSPWNTDHCLISFQLNFTSNTCSTLNNPYPDFKLANFEGIKFDLNCIDWSLLCSHQSTIQHTYDIFISILLNLISKHVPLRCKKHNKFKTPLHIRKLLNNKRSIYKDLKVDCSKKEEYKAASKAYISAVNSWTDKLESKVCNNPNSKKLYSYANKKLNVRNSIPPMTDDDGNILFSDIEKANFLNSSFQKFFTKDNLLFPPIHVTSLISMPNFSISPQDILTASLKMKNKTSRTPEGIPSMFIKNVIMLLLQPLCFIFNQTLLLSSVPKQWKVALVIPVFKKGDRKNPSNYRPISLTSSFCRLFESVICVKILNHLLSNSLLSPHQFGFIPNRSPCSQLLTCLDRWMSDLMMKRTTSVVYTDITKAFDSVSHSLLIKTLLDYGINSVLVSWLKNYLSGRSQQVCIGNSTSLPLEVHSGVPQGSVIGPLLFLIFINDITNCTESFDPEVSISMFADDTKIFGTCPIKLQSAINSMSTWLEDAKLKLAPHKCFTLTIPKPHLADNSIFHINNAPLQSKPNMKDLGVYISSNLKWSKHIDYIFHKANVVSYQILKSFRTKNIWTWRKLFITYVRPRVEYCTPVWSPYLIKDVSKVEQIQRHFTRVICVKCNISFLSYNDRLRKLNLRSLENRRTYFDLILLYKIIHKLSDLNFYDYFQYRTHVYALRSHSLQIEPKSRYKSSQWLNSFFVRTPKVWNSLPSDIVTAPSLSIFKSLLKRYNFDMV